MLKINCYTYFREKIGFWEEIQYNLSVESFVCRVVIEKVRYIKSRMLISRATQVPKSPICLWLSIGLKRLNPKFYSPRCISSKVIRSQKSHSWGWVPKRILSQNSLKSGKSPSKRQVIKTKMPKDQKSSSLKKPSIFGIRWKTFSMLNKFQNEQHLLPENMSHCMIHSFLA